MTNEITWCTWTPFIVMKQVQHLKRKEHNEKYKKIKKN